ncbi:MAG TPA: FAD:protein FMN transferase, partial [Patescibacteria group bacterium]|nr:FAD:protein FMN transferase [Patescibacteria group bacterium]
WSDEVKLIFNLSRLTENQTEGYFNIYKNGYVDPSGIVKGWAIFNAAQELSNLGYNNFYIEAGGDIEARGLNKLKKKWQIGIRNPFNLNEVIKIVELTNMAVATSGTYIRGTHIYNPHKNNHEVKEIKSISVIGPNIYEADRFATAAFVMGEKGINFIEKLAGFEGYMIDNNKKATLTSGFNTYVAKNT